MLTGIIDLHIHTAPDVRPRRFTDTELARLAASKGAAGVVLKSHHCSTVARAAHAQSESAGIRVMGGVTLNRAAGGLSAHVVAEACRAGARIVWLPTLDATNHRRREGFPDGIEIVRDHRLVPELRAILGVIADHDIALGTGHISPAEIRCVAEAALEAGVRRIIVNHPEHRVIGLDIEEQVSLARDLPVYFERCYAQPAGGGRYERNLEVNLEAIRAVGPESTVIATDSGQIESTPWDLAWEEILAHLTTHGVSASATDLMTRKNPAFLCGISAKAPLPHPVG